MDPIRNRRFLFVTVVGLLIAAALAAAFAPQALANHVGDSQICQLNGVAFTGNTISEASILAQTGVAGPYSVGDEFPYSVIAPYFVDGHRVTEWLRLTAFNGGTSWQAEAFYVIDGCEPVGPVNPPALFLMDVCEPVNGFSTDHWQSWDSNRDVPLFVAPDAGGPWYQTEYAQPPYIISTTAADALTSWMGAASYGDLWLKAGEDGTAVNVASAVLDRDQRMEALCGN